jgi:hypothetical protein
VEVDRISRMGGVGRDANPAWQNSAKRRRKFVEEIPPPEAEEEEPPAEPDEAQEPEKFSQWDTETAEDERDPDTSFRALA